MHAVEVGRVHHGAATGRGVGTLGGDLRALLAGELGELLGRVVAVNGGRVGLHAHAGDVGRVGVELVEVGLAHDVAAFHGPVLLGVGEQAELILQDSELGAGGDMQAVGAAQGVAVEADVLAHATGNGAAIAEGDGDGPVGEARLDVQGTADGATVDRDLAEEGFFATLAVGGVFLAGDLDERTAGLDAELRGEAGRDEDGVVPGDLGHRLGAFLEPAVVGEASVVDRRIGAKDEFVSARRGLRRRWRLLIGPGGI